MGQGATKLTEPYQTANAVHLVPGRSGQQTDHDRFQYAGGSGNGGNSGRDRAEEIRAVEWRETTG